MRRWVAALAGILAAAALIFLAREGAAWQQSRSQAAAARVRHEEMAVRLRAAQQGLEQERRQRAGLERVRGLPPAPGPDSAARAASAGDDDAFTQWLLARPENRARYLQAYRDRLESGWSLLFQALHLTAEQGDQLKDLLTQREDNWLTVKAAAAARGLPASAPEIQALDDQLDTANKAAIKVLVGQADYEQIHQYMHEEKVVPVVDQLAGEMYSAASPLTPEQAVGLTTVLAESSQRSDSGSVLRDTIDWDKATERAGSILNSEQLSVLSLVRDENVAERQSRAMMRSLAPAAYR